MTYQKLSTQQLRKFLKDSRHVTIQLRHGSVNRKMITRPEEASRMKCNTVAVKKSKSRRTELFHHFDILFCQVICHAVVNLFCLSLRVTLWFGY